MEKKEVIVILDNIRSAFNVGSILRTCDGAGVKKIILTGITPTPEHYKIKKTAIGAENFVEWEYVQDIISEINSLKRQIYTIISIEQSQNSIKLKNSTFKDINKMAIVFGNEISGISQSILSVSDLIVEIPMLGKKNSLNVSTCVGIILYTILLNQ